MQVLQSVREALENPTIHMTPMVVRPEDDHTRVPTKRVQHPPSEAQPQQPLPPEEVILRIDVREYDAVHSVLQVEATLQFLLPEKQVESTLCCGWIPKFLLPDFKIA